MWHKSISFTVTTNKIGGSSMSFLKKRSMRFSVGVFLILTMALWGSVTTAFADSGGATATVTAGTLSETGTFGQNVAVTLSGKDQLVPYPLPIQVTDATGSGAGWNLQISGTPMSDGVSGHPALSEEVFNSTGVCASGSSCTPPNFTPLPPVVITNTAQKFFSAAPNSGMGVINVQSLIQIQVPGNAFAGKYTTTITLASVSGP
jgi:WxL domain surface cell wall-binding